jgi:hypothetical protein
MNPDTLAALRALRDSDRALEARPEIEARLVAAFRRRRQRRQFAIWIGFAAAAAVVIMAIFSTTPQPARVEQKVEQTAPAEPPFTKPVAKPVRISPTPPREIVTEFFPLMDAPPPLDHGALMRVRLPASAMRSVGLPVREDRLSEPVQADVLVSEDGLATAIRFVKVSQ